MGGGGGAGASALASGAGGLKPTGPSLYSAPLFSFARSENAMYVLVCLWAIMSTLYRTRVRLCYDTCANVP
jgi:hypothetical protein